MLSFSSINSRLFPQTDGGLMCDCTASVGLLHEDWLHLWAVAFEQGCQNAILSADVSLGGVGCDM